MGVIMEENKNKGRFADHLNKLMKDRLLYMKDIEDKFLYWQKHHFEKNEWVLRKELTQIAMHGKNSKEYFDCLMLKGFYTLPPESAGAGSVLDFNVISENRLIELYSKALDEFFKADPYFKGFEAFFQYKEGSDEVRCVVSWR